MNVKTLYPMVKVRRHRAYTPITRDDDWRPAYVRDYARIINSPAFRRLQGKSQIFGAGSGDYYRNRLTHSLEVAQIAQSVLSRFEKDRVLRRIKKELIDTGCPGLAIDPIVVQAAALAHDLGHPPFGHNGERVINRYLRLNGFGCFESNAQNFRILMFGESTLQKGSKGSYIRVSGLNLTAAVLVAINKYPSPLPDDNTPLQPGETLNLVKGVYSTEWPYMDDIRNRLRVPNGKISVEAQVMNLCDDIAYSTHDIEGGCEGA